MLKRRITLLRSWIVLVVLAFAPQAVQAGDSEAMLVQPVIDNFDKVSTEIWRGAAPSDRAIKRLAGHGFKTVVDLRMDGNACQHEQALVNKLGMKYVHIPMGLKRPSIQQIVVFLRLVNDQHNQPVFVHCRQGADRTGVLVAIYRILVQHWPYEQVYGEMRLHHFKPWLAGMKQTVELVAGNATAQDILRGLMTIPDDRQAVATATAMNDLGD
jgi:protein tyrosine phosphatase (PTP) superfamily phosphohydrolase (DUF442 family)